jgi:sarcosine oxidase subunit alpha
MTGARLPAGGRIDRSAPLPFTWNGRPLEGFAGDTLASALLANGVRVVGRSFKYHRPRGIFAAGVEEPNAIVDVTRGDLHDPNARATLVPLERGLRAKAISGWPSVDRDAFRGLDLLHRFLPAGFYYKTFMAPHWKWWEPGIRRMAGLGRALETPDGRQFEHRHAHVDVLVVGAGPAGLAAARVAADAGLTVLLADENPSPGGALLWETGTIDDRPADAWADAVVAGLIHAGVRVLPATTAFAYYDHNTVALMQRRTPQPGWAEELLWSVQARQVVLATGALERPLVFPHNDRPGVMLASAVLRYLRQHAVLVGKSVVLTTNNDSAYATATALLEAGAGVVVADVRLAPGRAATQAAAQGARVIHGAVVRDTGGLTGVIWADIGAADGTGAVERVPCDIVATSGGFTPVVHLFSQSGGRLRWDAAATAFLPGQGRQAHQLAGAMNGAAGLAACLASGHEAGLAACAALDRRSALAAPHAEAPATTQPLQPYWHVPLKGTRQWLDLQNDVTVKDVGLAAAENFQSVEHLKRYTTLGMATDQGKTSNVNGLAVMAELTGRGIAETGTTTFRPPYAPVSLGAMAGMRFSALHTPLRALPTQAAHDAAGAEMREYGGWMRPACYPQAGESVPAAIQREAAAVRADAGLFDGSSLGKIIVEGPDAAAFLDLIYYNAIANLKPGRLRYVLLLRESGIVYDDGVIARLSPTRFLLSPSSSHTTGVLALLEQWHQTEYPALRVAFHDVTAAWATFAVCGPRVRDILATIPTDIDLTDAALPHMAIAEGRVFGVPARIARVSFTGERSYEISVPAGHATALWRHLLAQGPTPYGIESLSVLRAEKGYILIGTDTDGLTMPDDLGMSGPLRTKKVDFVGRRSLTTPDALRPDRRQFVGLLPENPRFVPAVGTHAAEINGTRKRSLGWITTAAFSPALGRSIALGMIEGGRARMGETVTLYDRGRLSRATICAPVFHDPAGEKLHG